MAMTAHSRSCPERIFIDSPERARLRALRVWHYRQLLAARMHARSCVSSSLQRRYDEEANTHLGFVQSLNDFFQPGDTAERDAAR